MGIDCGTDRITMDVDIKKAGLGDCYAIAELALIAGDNIPAYFWEKSRKPGQTLEEVGAQNASSTVENFSFKNTHIAWLETQVTGMLLAYRLPSVGDAEDLENFPDFIRPLVALEQLVPDSFYINMLAVYPEFRGNGIGSKMLSIIDRIAQQAKSTLISIEVFDFNPGALKLYQREGFEIIEQMRISSNRYTPAGKAILLGKPVSSVSK